MANYVSQITALVNLVCSSWTTLAKLASTNWRDQPENKFDVLITIILFVLLQKGSIEKFTTLQSIPNPNDTMS